MKCHVGPASTYAFELGPSRTPDLDQFCAVKFRNNGSRGTNGFEVFSTDVHCFHYADNLSLDKKTISSISKWIR